MGDTIREQLVEIMAEITEIRGELERGGDDEALAQASIDLLYAEQEIGQVLGVPMTVPVPRYEATARIATGATVTCVSGGGDFGPGEVGRAKEGTRATLLDGGKLTALVGFAGATWIVDWSALSDFHAVAKEA
jgi:hypothetical protein